MNFRQLDHDTQLNKIYKSPFIVTDVEQIYATYYDVKDTQEQLKGLDLDKFCRDDDFLNNGDIVEIVRTVKHIYEQRNIHVVKYNDKYTIISDRGIRPSK